MSADEMELEAEANAYARWLASGAFSGAPGGGPGSGPGDGPGGSDGIVSDRWWRGGGFGMGGPGQEYLDYLNRAYRALGDYGKTGMLPGDIRQWLFG